MLIKKGKKVKILNKIIRKLKYLIISYLLYDIFVWGPPPKREKKGKKGKKQGSIRMANEVEAGRYGKYFLYEKNNNEFNILK